MGRVAREQRLRGGGHEIGGGARPRQMTGVRVFVQLLVRRMTRVQRREIVVQVDYDRDPAIPEPRDDVRDLAPQRTLNHDDIGYEVGPLASI